MVSDELKAWRNRLMEAATADLVNASTRFANAKAMLDDVYVHVDGKLPDGVELPISPYDFAHGTLRLNIPPLEGRQWRGLDGTAGLVWRLRRLFDIQKFEKYIEVYNNAATTTFYGNGKISASGRDVYVVVTCGNQMPETCSVEEYEVTETVKRYKTVCK